MVGWAEDRLFVSDDPFAFCSLLLHFFSQFLLPLILPYFVQSVQSMTKLSRERWACAVRRDWELFDRNPPVARVSLTFMGKLSGLVMVGAVFCVIPLYQCYSAISSSDSITTLPFPSLTESSAVTAWGNSTALQMGGFKSSTLERGDIWYLCLGSNYIQGPEIQSFFFFFLMSLGF